MFNYRYLSTIKENNYCCVSTNVFTNFCWKIRKINTCVVLYFAKVHLQDSSWCDIEISGFGDLILKPHTFSYGTKVSLLLHVANFTFHFFAWIATCYQRSPKFELSDSTKKTRKNSKRHITKSPQNSISNEQLDNKNTVLCGGGIGVQNVEEYESSKLRK